MIAGLPDSRLYWNVPHRLNPANLLTIARLLAVPFVLWAILGRHADAALAILGAAALTDALDGIVARRFALETRLGAYLDPIADKLLASGVFVALAVVGSVPVWLVVLIFARDLMILAGAAGALLFTRRRSFPPSGWGKASTFVQIACALAAMLRDAWREPALETVAGALVWPAGVLTVWSGIHYAWRFLRTSPD